MFDNFSDDEMEENVIFSITEIDIVMGDLRLFFNQGVNLPLPPKYELKDIDFLEIFKEMFKPVDSIYELSNEQINDFMKKLNLRHLNRWHELLVNEGYANYGVDTNGEIRIIPTQKLKDAKNYRKKK